MLLSKSKAVKIGIITFTILFIVIFAVSVSWAAELGSESEHKLISTHEALKSAVAEAKDGDIIYVGDIDFTPLSKDVYKTNMKVEIKKNITLKSGKPNGEAAVLTNGSFLLKGSKISGNISDIHFENLIFDGGVDTVNLTCDNYPDEGYYMHAIECYGNVDAVFEECEFKNYTFTNGAIMEIRYADYTANEALSALYQDQSGCRLNLSFYKCDIINNAAFYSGGAFYIEADNNVTLSMTDCTMLENFGGVYYGIGGGAVYASGAEINMTGCRVVKNRANHVYSGIEEYISTDSVRGGGLHLLNCSLEMVDCLVAENVASVGGGIALTNTVSDIDGCVFFGNKAERCSVLREIPGLVPWDSMGLGGALYTDGSNGITVSLINSYIYGNTAEVAYGGIYQFYTGYIDKTLGVNYLKLSCCSYFYNACLSDSSYDFSDAAKQPWGDLPGDVWTEPNTTAKGCLIIDDYFKSTFLRHETPKADNGYNYYASPLQASTDGIEITLSDNKIPFIKLSDDKNWSIPSEVFAELIGDRYNGKLTGGSIGSNYSSELYAREAEPPAVADTTTVSVDTSEKEPQSIGKTEPDIALIAIGVVMICCSATAIAVVVILLNNKKRRADVSEKPITEDIAAASDVDSNKTQKQIIVARFSDEQIEKIMSTMPEVQLLTNREYEVFHEMLIGKKMGDIASSLYISSSTVKDFYKKIYAKMGVNSKNELFEKIIEETKKM